MCVCYCLLLLQGGGVGGAVACTTALCQFSNCTFNNNSADQLGGALWSSSAMSLQVNSSSIKGNKVGLLAGVCSWQLSQHHPLQLWLSPVDIFSCRHACQLSTNQRQRCKAVSLCLGLHPVGQTHDCHAVSCFIVASACTNSNVALVCCPAGLEGCRHVHRGT